MDQLVRVLMMLTLGNTRPSLMGSRNPDTKESCDTRKLSFPGCGTKPQVATYKVKAAVFADRCIHHIVAMKPYIMWY